MLPPVSLAYSSNHFVYSGAGNVAPAPLRVFASLSSGVPIEIAGAAVGAVGFAAGGAAAGATGWLPGPQAPSTSTAANESASPGTRGGQPAMFGPCPTH